MKTSRTFNGELEAPFTRQRSCQNHILKPPTHKRPTKALPQWRTHNTRWETDGYLVQTSAKWHNRFLLEVNMILLSLAFKNYSNRSSKASESRFIVQKANEDFIFYNDGRWFLWQYARYRIVNLFRLQILQWTFVPIYNTRSLFLKLWMKTEIVPDIFIVCLQDQYYLGLGTLITK